MHTPGPWQADDMFVNATISPRAWVEVTDCSPKKEYGTRKVTEEEARDNARLIAAAPELLEFARKVVAQVDADMIDPDEMACEWCGLYALAKELIAKAEGT